MWRKYYLCDLWLFHINVMKKKFYVSHIRVPKEEHFPSRHLHAQNQQWKHHNVVWNPLKYNKMRHKNDIDVVLESLLWTLNRFRTLFSYFYCWLWTSKWRLFFLLFWAIFSVTIQFVEVKKDVKRCNACLWCCKRFYECN